MAAAALPTAASFINVRYFLDSPRTPRLTVKQVESVYHVSKEKHNVTAWMLGQLSCS
ncbi:hypothetical protein J6590_061616 [Homalodisca vitripennis]|nr:hypothetical protein J6590_061616 [Homalodisca vitripennis]